jgi:hypothetical protein
MKMWLVKDVQAKLAAEGLSMPMVNEAMKLLPGLRNS